MKKVLCLSVFSLLAVVLLAQPSFVDIQKTNPRVANAFKNKEDSLKKQFQRANLQWPPKQVYFRSFKFDSQLEVWVRNSNTEAFKLFKTYKVCALSGSLGPKRIEGDYQVPEGFYNINELNPKSMYHLSLGINYPNPSDLLLSDSARPGREIYIHGNCITVGCIPLQNEQVEEVYLLATQAKNSGVDFIPIHIFPVRFNNRNSVAYLNKFMKGDPEYAQFLKPLREAYDYFEQHKQLPVIGVNKNGEYVIL